MIQALLKGKLSREQENMEDILTSNVFGQFSYLPASEALLPALSVAVGADNSYPLAALRELSVVAVYDFWPFWQEPGCISCEPDVVIRIDCSDGARWIVVIEAKYKSGKSSEADAEDERPKDQLAREWHNLVSVACRENRRPAIVYITSHMGFPEADIAASLQELQLKKVLPSIKPLLLWLSWRHVPTILHSNSAPIARDLLALLIRFELRWYSGAHFNPPYPWKWRFNRLTSRWCRSERLQPLMWRFRR